MKEFDPIYYNPPKFIIENLKQKAIAVIADTAEYYGAFSYLGGYVVICKTRKGYAIIAYRQTYSNRRGIIFKVPSWTYVAFNVRSDELKETLIKAIEATFRVSERKKEYFKMSVEEFVNKIAEAIINNKTEEVEGLELYYEPSKHAVNPWIYAIYFSTKNAQNKLYVI